MAIMVLVLLILIWQRGIFREKDMRDQFEKEIASQLSSDFAMWAFGEGYESKQSQELMKSWNELHGHQYLL